VAGWNSNGTEIVAFSVSDLVEHGVAWAARQAFEIGLEHAISAVSASNHSGGRGRNDPARTVDAHRYCDSREGLARNRMAVEDEVAAPHLNRISRKADHAFDEIGIFRGHPEDCDIAAPRQVPEDAAANRWKVEREAVARKAVGPFGNHEVVADVKRRQHRTRRDIERLNDKAPQRPRQNDEA